MVRVASISAVLLVLLGIPLWMRQSRDPAASPAVPMVGRPAPVAKGAPAPASSPALASSLPTATTGAPVGVDGQGVTYTLNTPAGAGERVSFGCRGATDSEGCEVQRGDTSCRVVLPVLCERADDASGVARQLGATQPVMGAVLDSVNAGHQRCATELGAGWRMAAIPADAGVLEGSAYGSLFRDTRYWVRSPGSSGHCWGGAG